ncbi:MalY/PatB family protein [Chloroflexota bacterium]
MQNKFDTVINRCNTGSLKWDFAEAKYSIKDILPMWVADMDFKTTQTVIDALKKLAEFGIFGYAHIAPSYYEAVKGWMKSRHNWDIQREWIVFSPGVMPAICALIRSFTEPGDQVIVQTPAYYPFFEAITGNKCEILDSPLQLERGQYVMDLADLEQKISPRTRIFILCSPHNPISRVWQKEELRKIGELCLKHDILIVSDEIHMDIIYDGCRHVPFATISEEFADKSIVCTAASKTFNLPGLNHSNIIISNPELRKRFNTAIGSSGFHSPSLFGIAATQAAYLHGEEWLEQLLAYLQGNIKFLKKYIAEKIPSLKLVQPQGTYLLWLDFGDCGIKSDRLGKFVREDAKVGLQAGTIFGFKEEGFERMNIACPRTVLAEGLHRIEKAINQLSIR